MIRTGRRCENSADALTNAIEDCSDRKLSVMGRNAARIARSLYIGRVCLTNCFAFIASFAQNIAQFKC